jgi:hypothetical protein
VCSSARLPRLPRNWEASAHAAETVAALQLPKLAKEGHRGGRLRARNAHGRHPPNNKLLAAAPQHSVYKLLADMEAKLSKAGVRRQLHEPILWA